MKPSAQSAKSGSSNSKIKKSSKDREKRKSQGSIAEINNHNPTEKGSPAKDINTRLYAGIDSDSLSIYAEQTAVEHLSEEITNILTEDINYRLRYIINDSLIKARLSGRNAISSYDLEQTFENLAIDKVYGAPTHPNWVPFGYQNLYYLDDKQVNLVEIAEEENVYSQYSETILSSRWIPEQKEVSKALKNYFTTVCHMIVSNDVEVRQMALKNIATNLRIGPITEWFYNFGYILLSKDITYDCLTLRALDLIRILENSPACKINVSEKQLKLLTRLILQRLLKSPTSSEVLRPICNVLAILCERLPLRDFVILKISQKMDEIFQNYSLAVITIIATLGTAAIEKIFLPKMDTFLRTVLEKKESPYIYTILEVYHVLCKENLMDSTIYITFCEYFDDNLVIFNKPLKTTSRVFNRKEINFPLVKVELLRTRRKVNAKSQSARIPIEEIFEMPTEHSKVGKKLREYKWECNNHNYISKTHVIIGKTTLLLPVFKQKVHNKVIPKCCDHTLSCYNL